MKILNLVEHICQACNGRRYQRDEWLMMAGANAHDCCELLKNPEKTGRPTMVHLSALWKGARDGSSSRPWLQLWRG